MPDLYEIIEDGVVIAEVEGMVVLDANDFYSDRMEYDLPSVTDEAHAILAAEEYYASH